MKKIKYPLATILLLAILLGSTPVGQVVKTRALTPTTASPPIAGSDHHSHSGNPHCRISPYPDPIAFQQPDGRSFSAFLLTEGPSAYLETLDGYTILLDPTDGYYRYATRGSKGDLALTGVAVSAIAERIPTEILLLTQILRPHLRYQGARLQELVDNNQLKDLTLPVTTGSIFPPAGNQRALLLLIDFPDQPFTYPTADFHNMTNQDGYNVNGNSGSFKDYYRDISYGLLVIDTDVSGWYRASNNRSIYGIEDLANRNLNNAIPLVRQAVDAAEAAGVDFSQYDGDGDGKVDVVEIIHSGQGAEESANVADIWSHRWALSAAGLQVTYDGKQVNDYIMQAEKLGPTNIANIGVLVHEFGHALGLPDLYDTDGSSSGLGRWCCMAGGTWNNNGRTPAQFSAWCKAQLGWTTPTVLAGAGNITGLNFSDASDEVYRINTPNPNEYFLLENRQKTGWDASIPGAGLAIYHVDESQYSNADENRPLVDLEQADGNPNSNNTGDTGDLFPGSTGNTNFSCATAPNSNNYSSFSSNVNVSNITSANNLINFTYGFCSTDCMIQGIQLSGGPANLVGGTYSQSFLVSYAFSPATGTLNVTAAGVTVSASITTSPQIVTLTGLPANGQSVHVTASFSSNSSCSASVNSLYQAPEFCNNDAICNAIDITNKINGAAVRCNNINATTQAGEPRPNSVGCNVQNGWCDSGISRTVWFQFTAPPSGSIDIDFTTPIDLQLALWEADDCQSLLSSSTRLLVAANDDNGSAGGYSPRLADVTCLVPGKTYFIQVDGWGNTQGDFTFLITDPVISCPVAPTATDGCGNSYTRTSTGNGEWLHLTDGNGERIASVNDQFNNLGTISAVYTINPGTTLRKDDANFPLLDRDWFINVANSAAATIRLYLTDEEFQNLIDGGGPLQLNDFTLLKVSGSTCGNFSNGTTSILNPVHTKLNFEGNNHMLEFKITSFSGFFPRSDAAALPIEMAYFTGAPVAKYNLLRWGSSMEENTKIHHIERLLPGERDWQSMGTLPAAGFSQQLTTYEWQDLAPYPIAYYRIKTIDFDGSAQYSDLLTLERKNDPIRFGQSYPTPAQNQLTSPIFTLEPTTVEWTIFSTGGQALLTGRQDLVIGNNPLLIDLSRLSPGLYYLRLITPGQEIIQKIIKS